MSITDELRDYIKEQQWCAKGVLTAIADRIDAAHERVRAESIIDMTDESMAEHGFVRLPKDADGEYIRIGDVMESGDGDVFIVSSVDYGRHPSHGYGKFWMLWSDDADFYELAYKCRHHHAPTVEGVLREMIAAYMDTPLDGSNDGEFFAKFAAKLRLVGDAE